MIWLLAMLLAQPATLNLNQQPIISRQNGARLSTTRQYVVDCSTNMTCRVDGGVLVLSAASGGAGSGGAPVDAGFVVWSAAATSGSTNERVLTAGTNVTLDVATPGQVIINASGGGGSSNYDGGYLLVQDEGADLTKRSTIDFTGAGVTCTDTGSKTSCDIPSGGSGGASPLSLILGTP